MPSRRGSAWRRRRLESRISRIAVPLAIPAALAIVVGVATAVTYATARQTATASGGPAGNSGGANTMIPMHRKGHRQNPAGM